MPSYVSHTIMAKEVYKELKSNKIDLNYILTYSLGGDLSKFAKCRAESHKLEKREEFFNNFISFIKDNKLDKDPKVLGVLYGHICHYALDDTMHPLVRKLSKKCKKNKKNHAFIELFYDNYLVNKKYGIPLNKYDNKKLFKGKLNKDIKKVINYTYYKTYNCKHLSRYYKLNIWLYKKIRIIYALFPIKLLRKVLGINKFLENNIQIDLLNTNHKISFEDINGETCSNDFNELYEKAIAKAIKDINNINKKLKA